jgi:hypothetical protein
LWSNSPQLLGINLLYSKLFAMNKNQLVDYAIKIYMPTSAFFSLKYIEKSEVDNFTYYKLLLSLIVALFNLPNYLVFRKYFADNNRNQAFIRSFSKYSLFINILLGVLLIVMVNWNAGELGRNILHILIYCALTIFTYLITIEKFENDESVSVVKKWEYCVYFFIMLIAYTIIMTGIEYAQEYSMLVVSGISFFAAKDKIFDCLNKKKHESKIGIKTFFKHYVDEYMPLQLEVIFGFGSIYLTYATYRALNGSAGVAIINSLHSLVLFSVSIYYTLLVYEDQKGRGPKAGVVESNKLYIAFNPGLIKYAIFSVLILFDMVGSLVAENFIPIRYRFAIILGLALLYVMAWQVKIGVVYKFNQRNREALGHNVAVFILSVLFIISVPAKLGAVSILMAMLGANFLVLLMMIFGIKSCSTDLYKKSISDMLIFLCSGVMYLFISAV